MTNQRNQISDTSSIDVANFVTSFLLDGLQRCSGVLYSGTLELSDESRQTAALPFIVNRATAYISSAVSKKLNQNEGSESSLLCGVLLCALGAGFSFVSNDVYWLTAFWGVVFGTGIGIAFPESLKTSQKFRSQTLLPVLRSASPSFACIIMPFFIQFLLTSYGLSGCLLVLSGVILNSLPFILTAVYRISFNMWIPKWRIRKKYEMSDTKRDNCETHKSSKASSGVYNDAFEIESITQSEVPDTNFNSNERNAVGSVASMPNGSVKIDTHQINNKTFHNMEAQYQNSNETEVVRRLSRALGSISEIPVQELNRKLFEKSFSEEDVLFEVITDTPRSQLNRDEIRRSENKSNDSIIHSEITNEVSKLKNRKRTASNPLKIIPNGSLIREGGSVLKNVCSVPPKEAGSSSAKVADSGSLTEAIGDLPEEVILPNDVGSSPQEDAGNVPLKNTANVIPKIRNSALLNKRVGDAPFIQSVHQNFMVTKSQTPPMIPLNQNFPLEIKVHVVECTVTESEFLECKMPKVRKNGYRRHSNSLITSSYDNIDFTNPHFSRKYSKPSSFSGYPGTPSSNMYLITEDEECGVENNSPCRSNDISNDSARKPKVKSACLESLKKLFKPSCMVIVYAFAVYEITRVMLLTIFGDLLPFADGSGTQASCVLIAFGLGGIAGRLSLKYWGDRLLIEGSNATAAVLFILDGVVVTGILWSPNLYWIGGFYATLGFLEIGISTTVWTLVSDYIDEDEKSALFSTCTLVCGMGTLCVPYTIGFFRDELGEYDGLLQITSGLSVLCAILCYVLPRFAVDSKHIRGS